MPKNLPSYEQQEQALTLLQELGIDIDDLIAWLGVPTTAASNATTGNAHAKLNWLLSTLATVNTNTATASLGTPTTAASNTTSAVAHAKLNWLLSTLGTVNTNTATANLGTPTSAASNSTGAVAHAKLNYLLANMPVGIVKSVQRGTVSGEAVGASSGASITVSSVNPLKSDITVYGEATSGGNGSGHPHVVSFDGTTLRLKANSYNASTFVSWQIVEYY